MKKSILFVCLGNICRSPMADGWLRHKVKAYDIDLLVDNSIIENTQNKTYLPAAKDNPERFEEINSGEPLFTGKMAVRNSKIGEIGLSYMGGIYNKFQDDGLIIDKKRRVNIFAIDFSYLLFLYQHQDIFGYQPSNQQLS